MRARGDMAPGGSSHRESAWLNNWFAIHGFKALRRLLHARHSGGIPGARQKQPSEENHEPGDRRHFPPLDSNTGMVIVVKPLVPAAPHGAAAFPVENSGDAIFDDMPMTAYLIDRGNPRENLQKLWGLLKKAPKLLLEIGCGTGEAALAIALKNPSLGVIATDLYDGAHESSSHSHYARVARAWRDGLLPAQQSIPDNLVILRAEMDWLGFLPDGSIDTVLLLNPEPCVGKTFLEMLQGQSLIRKTKPGGKRVVIMPYSRELGVMTCGGCEFEHDPDWSRGLGFILGSGLPFQRGEPVQWGVNLASVSSYTRSSTQKDLFVYDDTPGQVPSRSHRAG